MIYAGIKDIDNKLNENPKIHKGNENPNRIKKAGKGIILAVSIITTLGMGIYVGENIEGKIHDLLNLFSQNKKVYVKNKKDIHQRYYEGHLKIKGKKVNIKKTLKRKHKDFKNFYKKIEESQNYSNLIKTIQELALLNKIVKENGNDYIKLNGKPIYQEINSIINDLVKNIYANKCILNNKHPTFDDFSEYAAGILNNNTVNFSYQQLNGETFSEKFLNGYKELIQKIQNNFEKTYFNNPKIPKEIREHFKGKQFAGSITNILKKLDSSIKKIHQYEKTNKIIGLDF